MSFLKVAVSENLCQADSIATESDEDVKATGHRAAVVGAGLMGRRHAESLDAIRGVEIVGVCDLSAQAAQSLAEVYGCRASTEISALLTDNSIDIVVIATGDRHHLDAAAAAIAAGRNVFIEKPLASTVADAQLIADLADQSDRVVTVGHQLRIDPRFAGASEAVLSGSFGSLAHASFRRNSSIAGPRRYGSSTTLPWHVMIHDVDLLRFITGLEVLSVYARGAKVSDTESDLDSLLVVADLSDGSIASFESSWVLPEAVDTSLDAIANIVCVNGSAVVTSAEQGLSIVDERGRRYPDTVRYFAIDGRSSGLLHAQARRFVDAIDGYGAPLCSAFDGLEAVRVIEAVDSSLASGRPEHVVRNP